MDDLENTTTIATSPIGAATMPVKAKRATRSGDKKARTASGKAASGERLREANTKANKTGLVLKKLRSAKGVTIAVIMEATGWQAHSVRGFLSAIVRKKLGLTLISEIGKDGGRRYRIDDSAAGCVRTASKRSCDQDGKKTYRLDRAEA